MDRGETLQSLEARSASMPLSQYLFAGSEGVGEREDDDEEGLLGEVHELFANFLIGFVALHVGYLILFKWPLARFMLFVRQPSKATTKKV